MNTTGGYLAGQYAATVGANLSIHRRPLPQFDASSVYGKVADETSLKGAKKTLAALSKMAADSYTLSEINGQQYSAHVQWSITFPGYDVLGYMSQEPENHRIVKILASSMTQGGFRIISTDNDLNKQEKCAELEQAIVHKYDLLTHLCAMAEMDMNFGRGHLFVDTLLSNGIWSGDDPKELKFPLAYKKISKGQEIRFIPREPRWLWPMQFNANNALSPDFYVPRQWLASPPGVYVDKSRALPFVSSPVPDLMKPAFFFSGAPLILQLKTYVENWQAARDGVAELLNRYSKLTLTTPALMGALGEDEVAQKLSDRYQLMATTTNSGIIMLNNGGGDGSETETLAVVATPLPGVNDLLKSQVELLSLISGVPAMELWGDTPSGMNASGGDMIKVFANAIAAKQQRTFGQNLPIILRYIQMAEYGVIDDSISWKWNPIDQLTAKEQAEVNKIKIESDAAAIAAGILDGPEARERLASEPDSGYMGLDVGAFSGDGAEDDLDNG